MPNDPASTVRLPAATVAPGPGHHNLLALPTFIEIALIGEDDQPLPGVTYAITLPDQRRAQGRLDDSGSARVEWIARGLCGITFPDLDTDAWEPVDGGTSAGKHAPPGSPPAAPANVAAAQGDSIDSIAFLHGLAPATIWEAPENAALRALRGDPNVLFPGDRVFVPGLRPGGVSAVTGRRHVFRRRGVPSKFRLQLLKYGQPRANLAYRLEIAGCVHAGTTSAEGRLEHWVPANAGPGRLILSEDETYDLFIGHLDPVTEDSGLDARLVNLDYLENGVPVTPEARADALARFQIAADLPPTGRADEATRAALVERHGC